MPSRPQLCLTVSSSHEARHRIFQKDQVLFARAARNLGVAFPPPVSATELSTDLTETQPLERRVDTLLRMDTEDGSFLLAVESQGEPDPRKPVSWAYYLSYMYAEYRVPPVLLVVRGPGDGRMGSPAGRHRPTAVARAHLAPPRSGARRRTGDRQPGRSRSRQPAMPY